MTDTIFALSSGPPPAALALIRVSGPHASSALRALCGKLPAPRRAALRNLSWDGVLLDSALVLHFPGPHSATGEDVVELHLHGSRAVVRAVERALAAMPGLRAAQPGEFTRRALENGRLDLTEAEGLGDLLAAESENQRRAAMLLAGGELARAVGAWQAQLLTLSARVEALLDFADEEDVAADEAEIHNINNVIEEIATSWRQWLARPRGERLRDGILVAIAGPPNAGKSTLLNALAARDAAIVSPIAGTTRDIIEVPLALSGIAFRFADSAGLHRGSEDVIEAEGMARARTLIDQADLLLWLGDAADAPEHRARAIVAAKADLRENDADWPRVAGQADIILSAQRGDGMVALVDWLVGAAGQLLPREGEVALNARHHAALTAAHAALVDARQDDPLLLAESLRAARISIDKITGQAGTEDMLDALFSRFCIGK